MAEYTYKEIGRAPSYDKPENFDVTVGFTGDDGDVFRKTFRFLDAKQIETDFDARMQKAIANRIGMLAQEEAKDVYLKEEVESLLVAKGYITSEQTIDDLKTAVEFVDEKTAEGVSR